MISNRLFVEVTREPSRNKPSGPAQLSAFRPIKEDIPKWITGPALIEAAMPERLMFVIDGPNEVGLDYGHLADLYEVAPEEDRDAYLARLDAVVKAIGARLSDFDMEEFLLQPMNAMTLNRINTKLYEYDRVGESMGHVTLIEIVRHELGLKPARPS